MSTTQSTTSVRVGLIGCGNVSRQYLGNIADRPELTVVACADVVAAAAGQIAAEFSIPTVLTVDELLAREDIDIVVNLTLPHVHAEISMRALEAGKHVYTEKPLAVDIDDARRVLEHAAERGLYVGSAPDTFLGSGVETCRAIIDSGAIGTPVSANAFMMNGGPERFHPAPEFLYRHGAGPLLDMGPYFVTALISLLGPIAKVSGIASTPRLSRTMIAGERAGTEFAVETPTHIAALLRFARGAVVTLVTSFDVVDTTTPALEVHGTAGSLVAPAPNSWDGEVLLKRSGDDDFAAVPPPRTVEPGYMGMGLVDMAARLRQGRPPVASGQRGLHVLEVLRGILDSAAADGAVVEITPVGDDFIEWEVA